MWNGLEPLGKGTFGTVYPAKLGHKLVAIKMFHSKTKGAALADAEIKRYSALSTHSGILKLLDVGVFQRLDQHIAIGLVFERFDTNLKKFLTTRPLECQVCDTSCAAC